MTVTALVIGDPHFKDNNLTAGRELVDRVIEIVEKHNPTFVVILGDVLDKMNVAKQAPFELAYLLLKSLCKMCHVYLIIGNHDFIDQTQYLSEKHFFLPYKKWKNLTVVDYPTVVSYGDNADLSFVFCPYVPRGRFTEALNVTTLDGETWEIADCIFAHQEFRGCKEGSFVSEHGDVWAPENPPVISGHIHMPQTIGENIFYPGSSTQVTFSEDPDKKVWLVTFEPGEPMRIKKIKLGIRGKKTLELDSHSITKLIQDDPEITEKYSLRIDFTGSHEESKTFRKTKTYSELAKQNVKFIFPPAERTILASSQNKISQKAQNYSSVLKEIVQTKTEPVIRAYHSIIDNIDNIVPEQSYETVLVFNDYDDYDDYEYDSE